MSILAVLAAAAVSAAPDVNVELRNNTNRTVALFIDGRMACRADKQRNCTARTVQGFRLIRVQTADGDERQEKSLYLTSDQNFVWTVDPR